MKYKIEISDEEIKMTDPYEEIIFKSNTDENSSNSPTSNKFKNLSLEIDKNMLKINKEIKNLEINMKNKNKIQKKMIFHKKCVFCLGDHIKKYCLKDIECYFCGDKSHVRYYCSKKNSNKCSSCLKIGHLKQNCNKINFNFDHFSKNEDIVCFICFKKGHVNCRSFSNYEKDSVFNIFKQNTELSFFENFKGFTKNSNLRELLEKIGFDKKFYKIQKIKKLTLKNFEEILGYNFKNQKLLKNCLKLKNKDFERLEFFGDIIQEFLILTEAGKKLLKNDKKIKPKFLQKIKRQFLSNLSMFKFAHLFCFEKFINFENLTENEKIEFDETFFEIDLEMTIIDFLKKKRDENFFVNKKISDVWESVTAAVLIDGGFEGMRNNFFLFLAPLFNFYLLFEKDL